MKKAGRRVIDRVTMGGRVTRTLLTDAPMAGEFVKERLRMRQGDVIVRTNWVTLKPERWVLLRSVGDAELFTTEDHYDWMSNTLSFQSRQRWEAAFVARSR